MHAEDLPRKQHNLSTGGLGRKKTGEITYYVKNQTGKVVFLLNVKRVCQLTVLVCWVMPQRAERDIWPW